MIILVIIDATKGIKILHPVTTIIIYVKISGLTINSL
jgi:hypothetical protein